MEETAKNLKQAVNNIVLSQICFWIFIIIAIIILPLGLYINDGICYYQINSPTNILYFLAFITAGVFMLRATMFMPKNPPFDFIKKSILVMVIGSAGIIFIPYTAGKILPAVHDIFGVVVFVTQFMLVGRLISCLKKDYINVALFALMFLGGLIALLSLPKYIHLMLEGQILYQLVFSILFVRLMFLLQENNIQRV